MQQHLITLFHRDLDKLKEELNAYHNEADLWQLRGDIKNSPGTLALHLVGNLNHFIGAKLGHTGYVRNRPLEFSQRDVPRAELLQRIDDTKAMIENTLNQVSDDDLKQTMIIEGWDETPEAGFWLIHLTTHLNYHLGQINYHRRLL